MLRLLWIALLIGTMPFLTFAGDASGFASANNRFAVNLHRELSAGNPGNLVFSPISLSTALGMAYGGARTRTAEQMVKVLHVEPLKDDVHDGARMLSDSLRQRLNSDTQAVLSIANATWAAECDIKPGFAALVRDKYGAEANRLGRNPVDNARVINRWAAEHTRQKIQQVVTPADLSDQLALVITNAVYFLGRWEYQFEARKTQTRDFWVNGTNRTDMPIMARDLPAQAVKLLQADSFQAIELPYTQSSAAMVIFLPRERNGLKALEAKVTDEWLHRQIDDMQPAGSEVELLLPKVKTQGKSSMNATLKKLGMSSAFEPGQADFSGICGQPGEVYVDEVIHATFLEIDERGTEAAAVTAIMMGVTSAPMEREKIRFHVEHPFLFVIRDKVSGAILFMGHITDPRS